MTSSNEYADGPQQVCFKVTGRLAKDNVRLLTRMNENELLCIERFDYTPEWIENRHHAWTECDTLAAYDTGVGFTAYLKHTDIQLKSEERSIRDLVAYFSLHPPRHLQTESAAWRDE